MYGLIDLIDKVKRYFWFSFDEIKAVIITILALTFIVGFNDGRATSALDAYWAYNLAISFVVVVIVVMVHLTGQRIIGLHSGFRVEYKIWWYGIILGIVVALVTRGNIWLAIPGGIYMHHLAIHRLGYFRYGTNTLAMSMTGLAGSLANIILATMIWSLESIFGLPILSIPILDKLILFSWIYALLNLLPIPPLDGALVLFRSRLTYMFIFGSVLGYAIFLLFNIQSIILGLLVGGLVWLIYYLLFEKGAWDLKYV
ncbi:MAG: hypothetical protein ABII01_06690 [Candidatus Woesearchaeota archaeon]